MTEYSQSRIYSSLWSGQRTHCHDLSDPPFSTQLSWAILWGAYVSCPRSFSCHPSATEAGQSPAACWGSGMWVVLAGSQALCAGAMLSIQDHSLPPMSPLPARAQLHRAACGHVAPATQAAMLRGRAQTRTRAPLHMVLPTAARGRWLGAGV